METRNQHCPWGGASTPTIVQREGCLYLVLTCRERATSGQPAGSSAWFQEYGRRSPTQAADSPQPVYRQLVLPLPMEYLWFLAG